MKQFQCIIDCVLIQIRLDNEKPLRIVYALAGDIMEIQEIKFSLVACRQDTEKTELNPEENSYHSVTIKLEDSTCYSLPAMQFKRCFLEIVERKRDERFELKSKS
jgi:hypothetical protein